MDHGKQASQIIHPNKPSSRRQQSRNGQYRTSLNATGLAPDLSNVGNQFQTIGKGKITSGQIQEHYYFVEKENVMKAGQQHLIPMNHQDQRISSEQKPSLDQNRQSVAKLKIKTTRNKTTSQK